MLRRGCLPFQGAVLRSRQRVVVVALLSLGCQGQNQTVLPQSAQQASVDRTVYAWMQCQDCMSREREEVVARGDSAVTRLRAILIAGPPPSHMTAVQKSLQYLVTHADSGHVPTNQALTAQMEAFRSMYRIRAASALAGIGSTSALSALCAGVAVSTPGSAVREAALAGVRAIGGSCP